MCVCIVCMYISDPQKEDWSKSPNLPLLKAKDYSIHILTFHPVAFYTNHFIFYTNHFKREAQTVIYDGCLWIK